MPQENFFGKEFSMNKIIEELIAQVKLFTRQEMPTFKVNGFVLFVSLIALCHCPHSRIAPPQML